jgi:hypothetical protein
VPGQLLTALRSVPGLAVKVAPSANIPYAQIPSFDLLVLDRVFPDGLPPIPLLVVNPPTSTSMLTVRSTGTFLPAENVAAGDPLVQGLDLYGMSASGEAIATPSWAQVIVGGRNGPLLIDGTWNGARAAVLPFDVGHSAFAQDLAFPLLVTRLVQWLEPAPALAVDTGASIWLPSDVQSVQSPSGAIEAGPMVQADQPGVYIVASGNGGRRPGDALFVAQSSAPGEATSSPDGGQWWVPPIDLGIVYHDLWPVAIVVVLLALAGEWWVYAKKT